MGLISSVDRLQALSDTKVVSQGSVHVGVGAGDAEFTHLGRVQGSALEASQRNLIRLPTLNAALPQKWPFVIKRITLIG